MFSKWFSTLLPISVNLDSIFAGTSRMNAKAYIITTNASKRNPNVFLVLIAICELMVYFEIVTGWSLGQFQVPVNFPDFIEKKKFAIKNCENLPYNDHRNLSKLISRKALVLLNWIGFKRVRWNKKMHSSTWKHCSKNFMCSISRKTQRDEIERMLLWPFFAERSWKKSFL